MRVVFRGCALLLVCLACSANAFAAEPNLHYRIVDKVRTEIDDSVPFAQTCPGLFGVVHDINDSGSVVGFLPKSKTRGNAFVWDGTKTTRLKGGSGGSSALAINNAGVIAGVAYRAERTGECDQGESPTPARWEGSDYELLPMPADAKAGYAYAVSEDGLIGGSAIFEGDPQTLANNSDRVQPLVWRDGEMITLSLAMDYNSEAPNYTSNDTFSSAMVVAFGPDGRIYGNGWAIDDQGIRPWQFAMSWADVNSPPLVIGGYPSFINGLGTGSFPLGTVGGEGDDPSLAQFRDGAVTNFPLPDGIGNIYTMGMAETSAGETLALGFINEDTGPRTFIWQLSNGDPATSIPYELSAITDESTGWSLLAPIGFTKDGRILVYAADADRIHYFLVLEPTTT